MPGKTRGSTTKATSGGEGSEKKSAPKSATARAKKPAGEAAAPKARAAAKKTDGPAPQPAPAVGSPAPDFTLPADDGTHISLKDLRGRKVVLYFYPKDNTPGCTVEACGFRDIHGELEALGAVVLGVSRDTTKSHAGFREKQDLPFNLLSDPDAEVIAAYGSWGEKTFMGRTGMGILRTTVLIDEEGKVAKVYPKVSTKDHAAEIKADLEAMAAR